MLMTGGVVRKTYALGHSFHIGEGNPPKAEFSNLVLGILLLFKISEDPKEISRMWVISINIYHREI